MAILSPRRGAYADGRHQRHPHWQQLKDVLVSASRPRAYLASVLDYIVAHANGADKPVTQLVILGDLFDFWTYPPDQRPRRSTRSSMQTRGSSGRRKAVGSGSRPRGNVIYLRGNHDIGMTQDDLDRLPLGDDRSRSSKT